MTTQDSESAAPISERVRFWEEQDKINRELVPRVIRQHELLTRHIAEHESLPEVVANAVHHAVTAVRADQKQELEAEVARIKADLDERVSDAVRAANASADERTRRMRSLAIGLGSMAVVAGVAGLALGVVAVFGG